MNTAGTDLLARAQAALEANGLKVAPARPNRAKRRAQDFRLRIGRGKAATEYVVEAKRAVNPATVGAVVAQLRHWTRETGLPALLVTDYVRPPVAETLRQHQQQFADAQGNAYLTGEGLYVYVVGQRPKDRAPAPVPGGALTANGLKILFALLCEPALAQKPQRALAAAAGVALGAVPKALLDLQHGGHLLVVGNERRFNATKRLLDEWALGYARRVRPKTLLATYTTIRFDEWQKWKIDAPTVRWGGEPAAALLTKYLRPGILTLYADRMPAKLIVEQKLNAGAAEQRYVELRRPFWGPTLAGGPRPDVVAPVLVYADLLATGDARCIETADVLYEQQIAGLFPAA